MAAIPKRNPEGTIVEMTVDALQQLGLQVAVLTNPETGSHYGVRLVVPDLKCRACGDQPEPKDYGRVVEWITPIHPIYGEAEAWCGMMKFGLQRPAEAE